MGFMSDYAALVDLRASLPTLCSSCSALQFGKQDDQSPDSHRIIPEFPQAIKSFLPAKKGGQPTRLRAAFVYAAALSAGAVRNAGITSAANRSSCSSITDSGVPMLDCTLTVSSPGNCSWSSWR